MSRCSVAIDGRGRVRASRLMAATVAGQCVGCPCLFVRCRRVLRARVSRRADASVGASACRCRSRGRGPRDLIFDVKSEDPPPLEAVHEPLHRCALAGRMDLLMAVERRATPPDETSGVSAVRPRARASAAIASLSAITTGSDRGRPNRVPFARAAAMPALTRSTMSSRSYSASVANMFNISRPVDVDGSMPSEIDRTCTPRSRSRFTVFSTSIRSGRGGRLARRRRCRRLRRTRGLLHPGPLDRGLAPRGDIREDVALLHPGSNERIELQLRVLT